MTTSQKWIVASAAVAIIGQIFGRYYPVGAVLALAVAILFVGLSYGTYRNSKP